MCAIRFSLPCKTHRDTSPHTHAALYGEHVLYVPPTHTFSLSLCSPRPRTYGVCVCMHQRNPSQFSYTVCYLVLTLQHITILFYHYLLCEFFTSLHTHTLYRPSCSSCDLAIVILTHTHTSPNCETRCAGCCQSINACYRLSSLLSQIIFVRFSLALFMIFPYTFNSAF
jgi:hypothetical protein